MMTFRFTKSQEQEICRRYSEGENTVQLGLAFGVGCNTINRALRRNGIPVRSKNEVVKKKKSVWGRQREVCNSYLNGKSANEIAIAYQASSETILRILEQNGVERRGKGGYGDGVQHALDCTGYHSCARDCDFYIFSLSKYNETHSKLGISFDVFERARVSNNEYGDEWLRVTFATRQEAYFLEQALFSATLNSARCPVELSKWSGASEIRELPASTLGQIAECLVEELEELGVWDFAALRVPMTAAQRAICQQRALADIPIFPD
jgi:hypothetical protein